MTGPFADQLDETVNRALNGVGGMIGNRNLGDQVGGTVNNVSNGLLGDQGLARKLLRGGR
jgi:hypothetical protein